MSLTIFPMGVKESADNCAQIPEVLLILIKPPNVDPNLPSILNKLNASSNTFPYCGITWNNNIHRQTMESMNYFNLLSLDSRIYKSPANVFTTLYEEEPIFR